MKTPKKPEYRIVRYPDKNSTTGVCFFVDKKIFLKFLWIFTYTDWETIKKPNGDSYVWFNFENCKKDIERLREGKEPIYLCDFETCTMKVVKTEE